MNRKLLTGATAAAAAVALAVTGGRTWSAGTDRADVPDSSLRVGVLQLDLSDGAASSTLSFDGISPGTTQRRAFWLAANDASSITAGTLAVDLAPVRDVPAPCDTSRDKALAEIAAGVDGCVVDGNTVTGTPSRGNLSRELGVDIRYAPADDAATCATAEPQTALLPDPGPGDLRAAGRHQLMGTDSRPLVLLPGKGVCLVVATSWPEASSGLRTPDEPSDDAAQGDAMSVGVTFRLDQAVTS